MSFNFSQTAGTSGITTITVSATSREELTNLIENFTLENETTEVLLPIVQKAYEPSSNYIVMTPSAITWDSSGGTGSLNIQSNDEWTLVSNGWINLTRYEEQNRELFNTLSGNGNTIIGLRCSDNTGSTRTGGISGYCKSDSAISATTTVEQSGNYVVPSLTLGQYTYGVESSGQSGCSLAVTSNVDWIVSADESWIALNTTSGSNNGTISFDIAENQQNIERRGSIVVSNTTESVKTECIIAQSAIAVSTPYLIISPSTQNIPLSGGSFTISVSSNTEWDVTAITESQVLRPWISVDKLNGNGDDEVVVSVDVEEGKIRINPIKGLFEDEN